MRQKNNTTNNTSSNNSSHGDEDKLNDYMSRMKLTGGGNDVPRFDYTEQDSVKVVHFVAFSFW